MHDGRRGLGPIAREMKRHAVLPRGSPPPAAERTAPVATASPPTGPSVAVLLPCYNEEVAIGGVVEAFRTALPEATVYVYDNNSTDQTAERARRAGAVVRREPRQGKGHVVRRMFADVEADVYVMADGDGTYDASAAPAMIHKLLDQNLDMVVGVRLSSRADGLFRPGHRLGNVALTRLVGLLFGARFTDLLSGYRVLSRRFVKSFPVLSGRFEIETELTVQALELRLPVAEVEAAYFARPEGSRSKLRTVADGLHIARKIVSLTKDLRPRLFFGSIAAVLALTSLALFYPLYLTYAETGFVPRVPTAVLCASIMLLACLSGTCGLILDSVRRGRWEAKRMAYLALPPPPRG